MDGHEQHWGEERGEKHRRVGKDQEVKVDDREQHWCEEREEKCRRVGHSRKEPNSREKFGQSSGGTAVVRVSVVEEVNMDGREQHWGEERRQKRRRVGRDHQDGDVEHDDKDRDQRRQGEERGGRWRRVGHGHQGREQRGRSVERDHPNREQRGQEKVVEGDRPNREQRRQEKVMEVKTEKSKTEGESITLSEVERSFEFEGRLVGKRLVDADYDKGSTDKQHRKRHRRRSCSSTD